MWIPVLWLHLFVVNGKYPALCPVRQVFDLDFTIFILLELAFDFLLTYCKAGTQLISTEGALRKPMTYEGILRMTVLCL